MFRGNHPTKIDDKGRFKVPSAFKSLVDAKNVNQFFVTSVDGKYAEVWPLPEWEKIEAQLAKSSALDPAVEDFMNLVNYYGHQVELDAQGRLLVPQILRSKANLDGQEVIVIGKGKFLAVHNREVFEKQVLPPEGLSSERRARVSQILDAAREG
jgi:MraZ protein